MVGACPPPRVKHFYRESLFLLIAFAGFCSSTFFGITIVPTRGLFIVLLLWYLYHISSGRMGLATYPQGGWAPEQLVVLILPWYLSPYILREDELVTYPQGGWALEQFVVLLLPWCLSPHILREDELATYPQRGWALEQFVVLLLLWWLSGKVIGLFLNSSFYYRLRLGMPSLWRSFPQYPQGGWARYISSVRMSLRIKFWFSL